MTKSIKILKTILIIFIVMIAITFITSQFLSQITKKPVMILNHSYGLVETNSMEPDILVGDFIIMKKHDYEDLKIGDVIAFESFNKKIIIHEIISNTPDGFITKGVNNTEDDLETHGYITEDNYVAKVTWSGLSFIGKYIVNSRLLIIGIIIIFIFAIFIIQIISIMYQILEKQKYKHKSNLDKFKEELIRKSKNKD
ncbi:signal peptidase I [Acholeplasma granularum]|uniref:signal peptidase I n=1 Tax=Acholeplasma granularum TaxID=264635 RepID=UPI000470793E|nr:signal peptidase I [Acholeplasma granularum]